MRNKTFIELKGLCDKYPVFRAALTVLIVGVAFLLCYHAGALLGKFIANIF